MSFQMLEIVPFVERNRIQIRIYGKETTAGFVIVQKMKFYKIKQYGTKAITM